MCHAYPKPESQFSSGKGFNKCKQYSVLCIYRTFYLHVQIYNWKGIFHRAPEFHVIQRIFSDLREEPKRSAHWPLMFQAAMTLQTNSHLQKHPKAGLISVNFGCLNIRHPSQAPAPVYFCSQQRHCFTCLGCLPCDRMNHSGLQRRHLYCWGCGRWIR